MWYKFWQRVISCFVLAGVLLSLAAPTGAQAAGLGQNEPPPAAEERQEQVPPAGEISGQPERSETVNTESKFGINRIDASTVNSVNPGLLPAGVAVDVCFNVTVSSSDLEYLDRFDVNLPDAWTVNSVATDSAPVANGCGGALPPVSGMGTGNVVYWQSTGYPPATGCGAWENGTFNFCTNVTLPSCAGEPWSMGWNIIGDGYGSTPHSKAGTINVGCGWPDIAVDPTALSVMGTDYSVITATVTVDNLGNQPLEIEVFELFNLEGPLAAQAYAATQAAEAARQREEGVEIAPELLTQLNADETGGYVIYFDAQADLSPAYSMSWEERGWFVYNTLNATAERSQARVRAYLDQQGADYQSFWINNVIVVEASNRITFNGLMNFGEIESLRPPAKPILYEPVEVIPINPNSYAPNAINTDITHVNADDVWALGFTGEGIVVANIDTGVNYTHEALVNQYRGNLGGSFDHNYNWFDPTPSGSDATPNDFHNHGSHTMGTMTGSTNPADPANAERAIGMAPGTQWIACQAFEGATDAEVEAELLACGQFMAAPTNLAGADADPDLRPDVVNNSWGDCGTTYDPWYAGVINAWEAAGIYPMFSNGNADCPGYSEPPGLNTVGNPARSGNVTGVGSTGTSNGQYATHSNWGPTDDLDTLNPMGYPDLKPQVVAPGTNTSAGASGNIYMGMTGTSMASPHVAGLVALMWDAAPCLRGNYVDTETIIQQTAIPVPYDDGTGGGAHAPNYATGWGEIDALAAVNAAREICLVGDLPWVSVSPITATVGAPDSVELEVQFTCDLTATQQAQPLEGTLRIQHNDPTEGPVDVALEFFCAGAVPSPVWSKEVFVNGSPVSPIAGPHVVRPGDEVMIVDRVGAAASVPFSGTLTETWMLDSLALMDVDSGGVGWVEDGDNWMAWHLENMPSSTIYAITKTFEVQFGAWSLGSVDEEYSVEGATVILPHKVVHIEQYVPAIMLEKSGPEFALSGAMVPITLTIHNTLLTGTLNLTDTMPAGMILPSEPLLGLTASFGTALRTGDSIYWTGSANPSVTDVILDGGFELGTPNPHWAEYSAQGWDLIATDLPRSGSYGVWQGGDTDETTALTQTVTIPVGGVASLSFWLVIGNSDADDWMTVSIDGTQLFRVDASQSGEYADWTLVELDVSAFADGGAHELHFNSYNDAVTLTNFFVDDVALNVWEGEVLPEFITVTFNAQVQGMPGDVIVNQADLDWGVDYTSATHAVTIQAIPGVELSPGEALSGIPGSVVTYTLLLTNTGNAVDTFDLDHGGNLWNLNVPVKKFILGPGGSTTFDVGIEVPAAALIGEMDTIVITAASRSDNLAMDAATLTTTARAVYGLDLAAATEALDGAPGRVVAYTLHLTNTGNAADVFDLSYAGNTWAVTLPTEQVLLAARASADVTVNVTVPANALSGEEDAVTVRAVSQGETAQAAEALLTTTAKPVYGLELTPPTAAISGDPGAVVTYSLQMTNTGSGTDTFDLDYSVNLWNVTMPVKQFTLGAGASTSFDLGLEIPLGALAGAMDTVVLTATSRSDGLVMETALLTTTANAVYGLELTPPTAVRSGDLGAVVAYTLQVRNTGNAADTFDLSLAGNTWVVNLPAAQVSLAAGATANVTVNVTVPTNAQGGDDDVVTVTATSQGDAAQAADAVLTTTANAVYGLELTPPTDALSGDPGEVVVYTLHLANTGNAADTFDLILAGNTWVVNLPVTQVSLAAGATANVTVNVTVPANAQGGDDDVVTVTATSQGDAAQAAEAALTTTANAATPLFKIIYLPVVFK